MQAGTDRHSWGVVRSRDALSGPGMLGHIHTCAEDLYLSTSGACAGLGL